MTDKIRSTIKMIPETDSFELKSGMNGHLYLIIWFGTEVDQSYELVFYIPEHLLPELNSINGIRQEKRYYTDASQNQKLYYAFNMILKAHLAGHDHFSFTTVKYVWMLMEWKILKDSFMFIEDNTSNERIVRLLSTMETNHSEQRNLEYYSKEINVSKHYINDLIKKNTGLTFRHLSSVFLMMRILELFFYRNKNFNEIAHELHFSSQPHFNAFFKRHFKTTPGQYEKHMVVAVS